MATSESERITDYLCPYGHGRTMRRYGRISRGYIMCTVRDCDELHVEDSPGFKLKKGRNNIYNISGKKSAFQKKDRLELSQEQIARITRQIGDAALRFIQEDEKHDGLTVFCHDIDIDKPEWEFDDYEKYQGR